MPPSEVEIDEFKFNYVANERPHIQNDTITINPRLSADHHIKMSISFAFSQSTKLCTFEERVVDIVASTKDLPEILATTGKTPLSRKQIAQLIGASLMMLTVSRGATLRSSVDLTSKPGV